MLPHIDVQHCSNVHRVALVITGNNIEVLIGVPQIPNSTGIVQAEACCSAIREYGLEDQLKGLVFDTTASNTGLLQGACIKIQQMLGKELLWMACRHHVLEVILSDVFKYEYGPSTGPNISLFSRFKEQWHSLDHDHWSSHSMILI